jgi:hypothetical protein
MKTGQRTQAAVRNRVALPTPLSITHQVGEALLECGVAVGGQQLSVGPHIDPGALGLDQQVVGVLRGQGGRGGREGEGGGAGPD